ncbi:MAG: hypothetical protein AAFX99_25925 [Myxococcota bacterium]
MRTQMLSIAAVLVVSMAVVGCPSNSPSATTENPNEPAGKGPASRPAGKGPANGPAGKAPSEKPADKVPTGKAPTGKTPSEPTTQPATVSADGGAVMPTQAAIAARVKSATARLNASESGKLVLKAIEHHGGLQTWYSSGPIAFRFNYRPMGERKPVDSHQVVDTWSSRARHVWATDDKAEFGWNGKVAWVKDPNKSITTNPRFWSLTPYYFVGVPFVMADPGVRLEMAGEQAFEGTTWALVKVTFMAGTGDAPDDYYVLYIDKASGRIGGLRYIVTYRGFFKDGGHSPEKFMSYDGSQTVNGITLPKNYRTFAWNPDKKAVGEQVTAITLSDVSFKPDTQASYFEPIEGAEVLKGM